MSDASGAVVGGARVVLRNTGTDVHLETRTNTEGLFQFPDLPIGTYDLTVSSARFRDSVRNSIELLTGHVVDVKIALDVAGSKEELQVTDAAPLIQTTSSQAQTTVEPKQMADLPLNGRNALQLVVLTPGATTTSAGTIGGQQDNTGISINGLRATDNNYRLDGVSYVNKHFASAPTLPNPDTLQEFTVQSSNFSARESQGGAVIELSLRSGTNQLHGTLFDYIRNNALDARNYFSTSKPPFRRNQFGGTVGGPIVKEKLFFFGSYQGTRQTGAASPQVITVPSLAERRGDFSSSSSVIVDPHSGAPLPGKLFAPSQLDPLAQKVLALIPAPNFGIRQVIGQPVTINNEDQYMGRIDRIFGSNDHLSGHYFYSGSEKNAGSLQFPGAAEVDRFHNQSLAISETHTFSPSFTMTAAFGYSRNFRTERPTTPATLQSFGANIPVSVENAPPALTVSVSGYFSMGTNGVSLDQEPQTYDGHVSFFRSMGKHLVQFGTDIERNSEYATAIYNQSGVFTFDGKRSGNAMADFLFGTPSVFTQVAEGEQKLREGKYHFWLQDDWKVTSHLTLNVGLRWEPWFPTYDAGGDLVGFAPGVQSQVAPKAPAGLIFSGDPGVARSIIPADWNNLAPRLGFAWSPGQSQKIAIRGGFGIFTRSVPLNIQRYIGEGAPFRSLLVQLNNPPSFSDPFSNTPGGSPYPFHAPSPDAIKDYNFIRPVTGRTLDLNTQSSYTEEWNLTVERQIKDVAVSIAYVGNHSVGIFGETLANAALFGPGATVANTDARRPYAGLGGIEFLTAFGGANYHGMQVNVTKRYARGLTLLANYTYSKSIDNSSSAAIGGLSIRNPFNLAADRGPSDFDQTHRLNLAINYQLPRFTSNGLLGLLVNDWQANGILSVQSGLPFTVKSGTNNSIAGVGNDNADIVANPDRPAGAGMLAEYFNTAAFASNAAGTFGTVGRNSLRGPGAYSLDFSAFKAFALSDRLKLQLRAESFNGLNHTRFANPNATVTNPNFGRILTSGDPRVLQFALKLVF